MYMSGQRKEEAKLSHILLLLHLPQYFQYYTQEISFNVYTVLPKEHCYSSSPPQLCITPVTAFCSAPVTPAFLIYTLKPLF